MDHQNRVVLLPSKPHQKPKQPRSLLHRSHRLRIPGCDNMCSKSTLGNIAPLTHSNAVGPNVAVSPIAAAYVRAHPEKYTLVNVLEEDEVFENGAQLPSFAVKVPLGKLLATAYDGALDKLEWFKADRTIVTICNIGKRAAVAASELSNSGYKATYVTRGMFEWTKPAATRPELVITLASADPETVTLALTAAKVNQEGGSQTVLVGRGEGILPFRDAAAANCEIAATVAGLKAPDPLPPAQNLWNKYHSEGGLTMICTTCSKVRNLEAKHFMEGAIFFGMPDMLRMQKEATAALTF